MAHGLAQLLSYLSSTHLGTVVLSDFRKEQFINVGGDLILSDVDDAHLVECDSNR